MTSRPRTSWPRPTPLRGSGWRRPVVAAAVRRGADAAGRAAAFPAAAARRPVPRARRRRRDGLALLHRCGSAASTAPAGHAGTSYAANTTRVIDPASCRPVSCSRGAQLEVRAVLVSAHIGARSVDHESHLDASRAGASGGLDGSAKALWSANFAASDESHCWINRASSRCMRGK